MPTPQFNPINRLWHRYLQTVNFLNIHGQKWNITLFHYRNCGAATGDALAGFEIGEHAEIAEHLDALGYPYQLFSGNTSYRKFLTATE